MTSDAILRASSIPRVRYTAARSASKQSALMPSLMTCLPDWSMWPPPTLRVSSIAIPYARTLSEILWLATQSCLTAVMPPSVRVSSRKASSHARSSRTASPKNSRRSYESTGCPSPALSWVRAAQNTFRSSGETDLRPNGGRARNTRTDISNWDSI